MADPSSINSADEVGIGDESGTDVGAAATGEGGLICSICGKMNRTVPPAFEETDAREEGDEYCECPDIILSTRTELLAIMDATTDIIPPTDPVFNSPMLLLAAEAIMKNFGVPEKFILEGLVPEDYNHPSSEEIAEECSICLVNFKKGDVLGRIKCIHKFHFDCIKQWLLLKNFCPNCNEIAIVPPPL